MKRQRHHGSTGTPTPLSTELSSIMTNMTATATALTNIASGVLALDALITNLQNTPGPLGPSDQGTLDQIQAASAALAVQANAINTVAPGIQPPQQPPPAQAS